MDWILVWVVATLLGAWALIVLILWLARPRDVGLAQVIRVVPDVLRLARGIVADRSTPLGVRLALAGLAAWLISPIDLVPEFLPVIGPLDDVVVAILVLRYVQRRLGGEELRRRWPGTDDGYRLMLRIVGGSGSAAVRTSRTTPRR